MNYQLQQKAMLELTSPYEPVFVLIGKMANIKADIHKALGNELFNRLPFVWAIRLHQERN